VNPELIALLEKGFACQQRGNFQAAEKSYLKVLKRDKRNEFALNLMGVICVRSERYKEALEYLRSALGANAKDPETHSNLGLAYKGLNQFSKAQKAFEQSLQMNPQQPAALNNLGNVLAATNQHAEAIPVFEAALSLDSNYVDCLNNLAMSLKEVDRIEHALGVIEHAITIDATKSLSYNNKGDLLLRATNYEEAKAAFDKAISLDGNIVAKINLSTALKQLGDEHAARDALQEVLAQEENNSEAHNHLGVLLEQMGDTDLAATHFRLALKHTPNHASSFYQLSKLKDHPLLPQEIEKIESLLGDSQLPDIFRASLLFSLAWEYEYRKEYLKSIDYFIEAQAVKARRSPYVQSDTLLHVEKSQQVFPVTWRASREMQDDLPVPIFIVGMPRSGTTLTEQIIASHSDITGAGEVVFASDMLRQASEMTGKAFPESIERLNVEQARQLRTTYLSRMIERFGQSRFVVDKSPGNFNFLGTIAAVFPEAKILFCKRNAMDNCVSIFRLPFDDNQKWAHNLSALGHYYVQHEVLMKYWQTCYAKQILQVDYEDTVGDVEQQARRILDFIGVDFQEQVLSFYANKRIVMTPSSEQVRQPIYKTSVNSWLRYGDALKPLKEALSE
jgi:tetratricopeptide (TPR) repeat protein